MRADRLVAIVLLLQVHGQLTAGRLAEMLETSVRTVRRDLDALCTSGVPLYSQRGRGGGWALLGGHRLDLSGLTAEEARALFLVAGAEGSQPGGVEPAVRAALRKVLAALPEPLRAQAAAAGRATFVDPAGWGRRPGDDPPLLGRLQRAVVDREQLDLGYAKPGAASSRRRVHPYGLVAKGGVWYLLAGTDAGRRTFRVSRVTAAEPTGEPATVPEDLDLGGAWAAAVQDFRQRLQGDAVVVEVDATGPALARLTAAVGGWTPTPPVPDGGGPDGGGPDGGVPDGGVPEGWQRLRLDLPHERVATQLLAPFGATVRVRSPAGVRSALARLGEELVATHGTGEGGPPL